MRLTHFMTIYVVLTLQNSSSPDSYVFGPWKFLLSLSNQVFKHIFLFPCKRWLKKYTLQNHIFNIQFFFSKIEFIFVHPGNVFIMISFRFYSLIIRFVNFWKKMLKTSSPTIIQSKRISPHNQSHFDSNHCLYLANLN